jgi:hypothetical protein
MVDKPKGNLIQSQIWDEIEQKSKQISHKRNLFSVPAQLLPAKTWRVAARLLLPATTCSSGNGGAAPAGHHLLVRRRHDAHGGCTSPAGHHPLLSWCGTVRGRLEKVVGGERLEEEGEGWGNGRQLPRLGFEGIGQRGLGETGDEREWGLGGWRTERMCRSFPRANATPDRTKSHPQ